MSRSRRRIARRLHRAAANQSSPASAGAKFSKCHPNRHNLYPAFPAPFILTDHLFALRPCSLIDTRAELLKPCNPINPDYHNLLLINQARLSLIMVNVSFGGCLADTNEHWLSHRRQTRVDIAHKKRLDSHLNMKASVSCIANVTPL